MLRPCLVSADMYDVAIDDLLGAYMLALEGFLTAPAGSHRGHQ